MRVFNQPIYTMEGLRKNFYLGDDVVTAVNDVTMQIHEGDFVVIIGHSGSGKSTLLSLLGGLDRPTGGRLSFEEKDMRRLGEDQRALLRRDNIGFVFQFFNLIDSLTAFENIALPLRLVKKSDKLIHERVNKLLNDVGLTHRAKHYPPLLSGGEQQRVAIARALANEPKVVLADEPTGNLDTKNGQMVATLLQKLNQEHKQTFVVVTHDLSFSSLGNKVYRMLDGNIEFIQQ